MMKVRVAAATGVLLLLLVFCGLLAKPYYNNWKLQNYVEDLAYDERSVQRPPDAISAAVADRAARLGIPLDAGQVRVTQGKESVYLEARYFVRVDFGVYTVDLHFRPSAGTR